MYTSTRTDRLSRRRRRRGLDIIQVKTYWKLDRGAESNVKNEMRSRSLKVIVTDSFKTRQSFLSLKFILFFSRRRGERRGERREKTNLDFSLSLSPLQVCKMNGICAASLHLSMKTKNNNKYVHYNQQWSLVLAFSLPMFFSSSILPFFWRVGASTFGKRKICAYARRCKKNKNFFFDLLA